MNPQDPLAQLNPLREPALIGWWPLAPGWWILLLLLTIVIGGAVFWLARRHHRNIYRRQALAQLQDLNVQLAQNGDTRQYVTNLNALLKSTALRAYPHTEIAAINSDTWLVFLNDGLRSGTPFDAAFTSAIYRPETPSLNIQALQATAAQWIKQHKGAV